MAKMKAILVAVDGSDTSDRAVTHAAGLVAAGLADELHLLNVQPNLRGAISSFVSRDQIDAHHREEGEKGLATAVAVAKKLRAGTVIMGTRGHTGLAGVLLGSVAQDVIAHAKVPVTLVK